MLSTFTDIPSDFFIDETVLTIMHRLNLPDAPPAFPLDASNITIVVVDDDIPEFSETFDIIVVLMSTSFSGLMVPDPITVEIVDDDGKVSTIMV